MLKDLLGYAISDFVGGFIMWLLKGAKKDSLKKELLHTGWRNEIVSFMAVVIIAVIILLIITLLV